MSKLGSEIGSNQTITPYQAFAITLSTMVGVGLFSLPRDVGQYTGSDMVWVIILSGLVIWLITAVISLLCERFPALTIVEFAPLILGHKRGSRLGRLLSIPFLLAVAIFWIVGIALSTRMFGEILVTAVLVNTPIEAIMAVFLVFAAFAGGSHPTVIAKFNEFLLPVKFVPIFLLLISLIQRGEIINLLPLFQPNWNMVIHGMLSASYAYAGFKVAMIFSGFYAKPEKGFKAHSAAVLMVIFLYWFNCLVALSVFGEDEVSKIFVPGLEVIKVINLKVLVFERLESAILSLWLIAVFTSITNLQMSFVEMVIKRFQLPDRSRRWIAFVMLPFLYKLATFPTNVKELGTYVAWFGNYGLAVSIVVPGILLIVALIRGKKGGEGIETSSS